MKLRIGMLWAFALAVMALSASSANAQSTRDLQQTGSGIFIPSFSVDYWNHTLGYEVPVTDSVGLPVDCIAGCSGGGGGGGNSTGAPAQVAGSCGTTSSIILAASAAVSSMSFHLPSSAANAVWLNVAGNTATTASPSFDLQPGQTITFSAANGLLPTTAVTCIATASTNVTEIYK